MRRALTFVVVSGFVVWGTVRCGDVPETQFGTPSGLTSTRLPGEAGATAILCEAGIPTEGGPVGDAGCPSWANEIYPNMQPNGPWQCTSSACHSGPDTPPISPTDPTAAYNSLKAYKNTIGNPAGLLYIDPTQKDPTKSTIVCNLSRQCGQGMPNPPGKPLTCADLAKITDWVLCGSPNN